MPTERDEDSGQFREQYPRELFLDGVGELEVATTANVAEYVGCSYDLAYRRLKVGCYLLVHEPLSGERQLKLVRGVGLVYREAGFVASAAIRGGGHPYFL